MAIKYNDRHGELIDHLAELRTRLMRVVVYLAVGIVAAWFFYDRLFSLLTWPMAATIKHLDSKFLLTSFPEAFMIRMQICAVAGAILTCPLIILEIWGFVAPGLTPDERRPLRWIGPLSALLFMVGVVLCYLIMPVAFEWFSAYVPKNAELRPSVQGSVIFIIKMLLVFGLLFELPVVLMLLGKIGIVDSRMLKENWRVAMVAVSVVAAVATPSNDALTMMMAALPVALLYFLGIFLVRITEGKPKKRRSERS
ncbi:MAG: twin-arginine translocase subunit TatC [Armatimonadota bacterium]